MKWVLWFSWRSGVVKALFQGAKRCGAGTATCDESFDVEVLISGNSGGNRFLP